MENKKKKKKEATITMSVRMPASLKAKVEKVGDTLRRSNNSLAVEFIEKGVVNFKKAA